MAGGAAFIAAPIVGAQQEGATGFVKGLGLGLVRTDNCKALSLSLLLKPLLISFLTLPRECTEHQLSGVGLATAGVVNGAAQVSLMQMTPYYIAIAKQLCERDVFAHLACTAGFLMQVVRGVVNTPEAIHQSVVEGKEWDSETRQWKEKVALLNLLCGAVVIVCVCGG
jgi:hypothetical protein